MCAVDVSSGIERHALKAQQAKGSIVDLLACPASANIDFERPKSEERLAPPDLS